MKHVHVHCPTPPHTPSADVSLLSEPPSLPSPCLRQVTGYLQGPGKGAFFWNFKVEQNYEEWNFLLGLQQGYLPARVDTILSDPMALNCQDLFGPA